jgi:hypothetical protein
MKTKSRSEADHKQIKSRSEADQKQIKSRSEADQKQIKGFPAEAGPTGGAPSVPLNARPLFSGTGFSREGAGSGATKCTR